MEEKKNTTNKTIFDYEYHNPYNVDEFLESETGIKAKIETTTTYIPYE